MYPTASYVFGDIHDFKHTNNLESHKSPVHTLEFSPDGKYITSGDDNSILTIRRYKTGDMIHALAWHPTVPRVLVVGSINGDLNKICLSTEPKEVCSFIQCLPVLIYILNGQKDFTTVWHLCGYIHTMTFKKDGSQLAMAFGRECKVILMDQD
ncbi:hypothetical protein L208DRAFT_1244539 [Tricholoma matsutake]|nr:hypothetical protein L208DRAFT_1244539 [Tricholoma matsutake 945]